MTDDGTPQERGQPLYLMISEALEQQIADGRFAIASMLPTETELCRTFGVSRYTVREALRRLTELGLVQRRAGAGTIVIADKPPTTFVHRVAELRGLLKYPPNTYRERLSFGPVHADRHLAALIGSEPGAEWFQLTYVRRTEKAGPPITWADFYVLPEIAARLDPPAIDRQTVYEQIEHHVGYAIKKTEIRIFASAVGSEHANVLEVAEGAPALTIVRRYLDENGRNFMNTVTIHPENRFEFTMDLIRDD